jgi:hypothetical protein
MTYEYPGSGGLDYAPCRYGNSKLLFRGPRRSLEGSFCAALGGSETYGKFVEKPWPSLLEQRLNVPVVNFGYVNAGVDVFANEPLVGDVSRSAKVTVVQLMGAPNMSNRFYAVHPRRNDRFLRASSLMRTTFPEADFSEFNFTRHMLCSLRDSAPKHFGQLVEEIRSAWVVRMGVLLDQISGPKVLLWLRNYHPTGDHGPLGPEPALVSAAMVDRLRAHAEVVIDVEPSSAARQARTAGMVHAAIEALAAADMPGPRVHEEVAEALAPAVAKLM